MSDIASIGPQPPEKPNTTEAVNQAARSIRARGVSSSFPNELNQHAGGGSAYQRVSSLFGSYAPLGYWLPFEIMEHVELLATYNPDFSQAVDNIRSLANSGHQLLVEAPTDLRQRRIKSRLEEKARTIQESHGGIDGIIDKLLDQGATYGAMCGEWVLSEDLDDVVDFIDINPKYIRFFWDEDFQRWHPYQKVTAVQAAEAKDRGQEVRGGSHVRLNTETFRYYAFDAAPQNPYGTPPFVAALVNIAIQSDMVDNMSQIVKKLGLLGIVDMTVETLPKAVGESDDQYAARAAQYLDDYAQIVEEMVRDGGLVHFDDAELKTTSLGGNAAGATNIFKQNEELIFSGLKSMPSVQGRSYCVVPSTRVLTSDLRWVRAGDLSLGDELIGFDEDLGKGRGRGSCAKMRSSIVEVNRRIRLDCVRVITDKGAITVSKQHPIVMKHRSQTDRVWMQAADLRAGDLLPWVGEPWEVERSYEAGYLAGMFDGEGTIGRAGSGQNGSVTMKQREGVVLDETVRCLKELGFETTVGPPTGGTNKDVCNLRILGGKFETLRLLGQVRPLRLLEKARMAWEGAAIRNGATVNQTGRKDAYATVISVEEVGKREVVALQTSSRTFIAEGLLNHNSTTETYAGVAYDIIIRNTRKYQRACKRMIEAGYWLMAGMWGEQPDSIGLKFHGNKTLQRLQEASAAQVEIRNDLVLWENGIIDQQDMAQRQGFDSPKTPMDEPKSTSADNQSTPDDDTEDEAPA